MRNTNVDPKLIILITKTEKAAYNYPIRQRGRITNGSGSKRKYQSI